MLYKTVSQGESSGSSFIAACFLGVLSLGSMANGVLALPLMTAYAAITRLGWRRVVILAVLSSLGVLAYFHQLPRSSRSWFVARCLERKPDWIGALRPDSISAGRIFTSSAITLVKGTHLSLHRLRGAF